MPKEIVVCGEKNIADPASVDAAATGEVVAFNSDIAYTKWPLFDDVRNNYAAPSPLKDL